MPNWDFEANKLSDRWPTTFQNIWHPHSWKSTVVKLSSDFHSKSVMSCEFFQMLGKHSIWFLHGNCPLGFLFPIKICLWILQTGQISNMLHHDSKYTEDDDHLSFFSKCVKEQFNHGIRNQLILLRLCIWHIIHTILLNIFLLVWSIPGWMLSLE
jgi:hypothetical protein